MLGRLRNGPLPAEQAAAIEKYRAFCVLATGRTPEADDRSRDRRRRSALPTSPRASVGAAGRGVLRRSPPAAPEPGQAGGPAATALRHGTAGGGGRRVRPRHRAGAGPRAGARGAAGPRRRAPRVRLPVPARRHRPSPPAERLSISTGLPPPRRSSSTKATRRWCRPVVIEQSSTLAAVAFAWRATSPRWWKPSSTRRAPWSVTLALDHPLYDAQVLKAASKWRYQPATRSSRPVQYRRRVRLAVSASGASSS